MIGVTINTMKVFMKTKFLYKIQFLIITIIFQTYAMENSIIPTHVLTQSTNNQLDTYKQLDIPDNNKAKKALLKTIIEKNNLTPTTPLLDYTEKETQSDLQKAIYIDIDLDNHIKEK